MHSKIDRSSKQETEIEARIQAAIVAYQKKNMNTCMSPFARLLLHSLSQLQLSDTALLGLFTLACPRICMRSLKCRMKALVRWKSRLCRTCTGYPASPKLNVAREVRGSHVLLSKSPADDAHSNARIRSLNDELQYCVQHSSMRSRPEDVSGNGDA